MEIKKRELYEVLLPEFFDENAIKVPPEITYRIDNAGERLYARQSEDGKWKIVPSVTTVLRKLPMAQHLLQWYCDEFPDYEAAQAFVEKRADYGTHMHIMFKELLKGGDLVFNERLLSDGFADFLISIGKNPNHYDLKEAGRDLKKDMFAFVKWCADFKVKPLAIEYIVFGDKYAGAMDLCCKITVPENIKIETYQDEGMFAFIPGPTVGKGEREITALIDFKSGRKGFHLSNVLQLHALREQWNIEHPEHQIDTIANYGCKDYRLPIGATEPYNFKRQERALKDARGPELWNFLLGMYHLEEIRVKDRVELTDQATISLKSDLSKMVEKSNAITEIEKRILEESNGRKDTTGSADTEAAGDRENKDRGKGSNTKRRGKADESGLFQS